MKYSHCSATICSSEADTKVIPVIRKRLVASTGLYPAEAFFYAGNSHKEENTIHEIFYIAIAGALGTVSRFGLTEAAHRVMGSGFPYGTLLVNILGSMLIGYLMQVGFAGDVIPRSLRLAVTVGFLGAFTTFSTFSYETAGYIQDGAWISAMANIATNMGLSILATIAGLVLGRITLGGAG